MNRILKIGGRQYIKQIRDYYTGVRRVLTNVFGKREVPAYVTSAEKDSRSRRLFFGTVFPEQLLINLFNIAYCAMKLLPYSDETFSKCRGESVQELRFALSEKIRQEIFYATFVSKFMSAPPFFLSNIMVFLSLINFIVYALKKSVQFIAAYPM